MIGERPPLIIATLSALTSTPMTLVAVPGETRRGHAPDIAETKHADVHNGFLLSGEPALRSGRTT